MKPKLFTLCLLIATAKTVFAQTTTDATEKKVDYLEQIYFSGKNHEELNIMMMLSLQQIEAIPAATQTIGLVKQYAFLKGIQQPVKDAKNACDAIELIATGIYNIDAATAQADGVHMPSSKASANADAALKGVGNVSKVLSSTSGTLNTLAYNQFLLTGSTSGWGTASKVAGVAGTAGAVAGSLEQGKELLEIGKSVFKPKDKGCKEVNQKVIQIGVHTAVPPPVINKDTITTEVKKVDVPATGVSIITIKNINYSQLSALSAAIGKIQGVSAVNADSFISNTATLTVNSSFKLMELVDNILKANTGVTLNQDGFAGNTATLIVK